MGITSNIIQKLQFEIDMDSIDMIQRFFVKMKKYRKPAGYKHDGLDLTKEDKEVINMFY